MIDRTWIDEHNRPAVADHERDLEHVRAVLARVDKDADRIIDSLAAFSAAAPSWALGTGATRFGRFPVGGDPRTTEEKIDDVALLNSLTTANRTVSLHVPWDNPADPKALREYAEQRGVGFDSVNSNTFQNNPETTRNGQISYKFGSLCNSEKAVREAAIEHNLQVINIGIELGSDSLVIWLGDGTSFPGQGNFRTQFERVAAGLAEIHDYMPHDWKLFTEHKPYEPAFYSSVNHDWGASLLLAQAAGDRAGCIVDLGHHLPNANIEQVVSRLNMVGRLGGFHFNDSKYGDDDLTTGSIKPFQLFLIFTELLDAGHGTAPTLMYMIDQVHLLKDPIEDLLQATDNLQVAHAQALCLDRETLGQNQEANDPVAAAETLNRAFRVDVRALVAEARRRNGGALDLISSYRASGYRARTVEDRGYSVATGM